MCFSRRSRWDEEREPRRDVTWDLFERDTREVPPPVNVAERDPEPHEDSERERETART